MAIKVTETGGNFSTATWYRAESVFLNASTTSNSISTVRYGITTFDNAGNLRGAVFALSGYVGIPTSTRSVYVGIQKGTVVTTPIATPGVVNHTGHTFTGALSGVTISNASPCVVTYASHGRHDGDAVTFTTTGAVPTGITAGTTYYVKKIDADTFWLYTDQSLTTIINTSSAGSGTHSLWYERVQFTTTGALPTGITANTFYWVKSVAPNQYSLTSAPAAGSTINFTGSTSGTHTAWDNKEYVIKSASDIAGTGQTYFPATCFFIPFLFSGTTAVDTTASGWRWIMGQVGGAGSSWYIKSDSAVTPFHIAWCDTTVAWSSGDNPVICAPLTFDTTTQFTGTLRLYNEHGTAITSFAGLICTPNNPANRGYSSSGAGNMMFGWDGTASRTLTIDGVVWIGTHAGVYIGTEDAPISYANKAILNLVNPVTLSGATTGSSGFADTGYAGNYYSGGSTFVLSGEYPTQRYATLVSDANTGQADLVVDDASGFAINDYVYITKHDAVYSSSLNATRYQIQNIVGSTITLTANVSTNTRLAGGRVMLCERGYGVQIYSTSLTSYVQFMRGHGISNFYCKGVYNRGAYSVLGYSSNYRFPDNESNYRAGGWYVGYCFCENYQNAQSSTTNIIYAAFVNSIGCTVEEVLAFACIGVGPFSQWGYTLAAGVVRKCGPVTVTNCFGARNSTQSIICAAGGIGRPSITFTNNIVHNCVYGVQLGQDSIYVNNYAYGSSYAFYIYSSYFLETSGNVSDRSTYGYYINTAGTNMINVVDRNTTMTNVTNYNLYLSADSYFQWDIINPSADIRNLDTTYQPEIAAGSEIRVSNNNSTTNDDLVITANGFKRRCGTGLTDTTVYASNSFSMRFQPNNQPEPEDFTYDQIIGNQQGYDMFVYMWIKIATSTYYAGTHRLPRLYVTYDQTSEAYAQAAESTSWQQLIVPFKPTTTYPSITISLNGYTDAADTDAYFYLGQIGVVLPAGRNVDPGALDYWAEAKPLTGLPTGLSAADVWAIPTSQLTGAGTIGRVSANALTVAKFLGLK